MTAVRKHKAAAATRKRSVAADVRDALAWLEKHAKKRIRDEMGPRYGVHVEKAHGVAVSDIHVLAKRLGRSHDLAEALWKTGWYEARMLAAFVDEPERVTPAQMDRWCKDFDNWGIVDTICFHLFDRTPHAFAKARRWSTGKEEFVKRAGFVLWACLALHDKGAGNERFVPSLPLLEKGAFDERNFVKKGVSWALRAIGGRNPELRAAVLAMARRLAASPERSPRSVGKLALRDLR